MAGVTRLLWAYDRAAPKAVLPEFALHQDARYEQKSHSYNEQIKR
ncbi:MAG TPA: hypothetical protein VF600_01125 [Abditibacteriaceae bacterium]|jgi:hypothetical protein